MKEPPRRREKRPVTVRYKVEINPSYEWLGDAQEIGISHRELEVLALAAEGYTNKEIAEILHIQHQSVKNHMHHLMDKLGVGNGASAVTMALFLNLIKMRSSVGGIKVELTAEKMLENLKKHLDGENWSEGFDEKKQRAINVKLRSHGIDVDKLSERKKNERRSYWPRPLYE